MAIPECGATGNASNCSLSISTLAPLVQIMATVPSVNLTFSREAPLVSVKPVFGNLTLTSDPPIVPNRLPVPHRALHFSTAAPSAIVSPIGDIPSANLAISVVAPVINASPVYFAQGTVVSDQISDMGFSLPGHGPGLFIEIRASDTDQWEVISLQVPRR